MDEEEFRLTQAVAAVEHMTPSGRTHVRLALYSARMAYSATCNASYSLAP